MDVLHTSLDDCEGGGVVVKEAVLDDAVLELFGLIVSALFGTKIVELIATSVLRFKEALHFAHGITAVGVQCGRVGCSRRVDQ